MIIIEYVLYRNPRKAVCMARLVVIGRRPTGEVAKPPRPARQDSWAFLSLTGPRGVWHFPFRRPQAAHDYCFFGYGLRDQAWVAGCITSAMGVGHPQFLPCGPASSSLLWDCQSICHHSSQKMVHMTLMFSSGIGYRRACIAWAFRQPEWKAPTGDLFLQKRIKVDSVFSDTSTAFYSAGHHHGQWWGSRLGKWKQLGQARGAILPKAHVTAVLIVPRIISACFSQTLHHIHIPQPVQNKFASLNWEV
jgi:hypothetical protein